MKWLEKRMPDAEMQLSRVRSWDWLLGGFGMKELYTLAASVVTGIGTFVYAPPCGKAPLRSLPGR